MPVINRTADLQTELTAWRHDFHRHPELAYEEQRTADLVALRLEAMGIDVVRGLGGTGVLGIIEGKGVSSTRAVGLRADMDALPILETSGVDYPSENPGVMHACGHDGHTSMLLGAARLLAENRNFSGKVYLIFQPAEEGGAGAARMMADGLFRDYPMQAVFALHNLPGLPVGNMALCQGPAMASSDTFYMTISGRGGHAALPHKAVDPVLIASQLIVAAQALVSRQTDPLKSAVLSVCQLEAGHTTNVIPQEVKLAGTIRTLDPDVRSATVASFERLATSLVDGFGGQVTIQWEEDAYPATINHDSQMALSQRAAEAVVGPERLDTKAQPLMASEDFAFMLNEVPGSYAFLGNGDSAGLHDPAYVFNDEAMPYGVSYLVRIAEEALRE